jgi:carbamoyl-phosphate synthase large subunit
VLSAGRRVELVQQFQAAARELLPGSLVLAGDASPELSAACQIADRSVRLPRVSNAANRAELVAVCRGQSVGLIVPTTDTELLALASLPTCWKPMEQPPTCQIAAWWPPAATNG